MIEGIVPEMVERIVIVGGIVPIRGLIVSRNKNNHNSLMYRDPVPKNSWVFLTRGRGKDHHAEMPMDIS